MWLECSGECRYVQDHPFYVFLSGDSRLHQLVLPHGYITKLHLNCSNMRKGLHCGFSVSAEGHRIVDLFLPSTSQGKLQDVDFRATPSLQIDSHLRC